MFDSDTIKICQHMVVNHSEPDIEYHSVEHDIIQTKTSLRLRDFCKAKSLYEKVKGTIIVNDNMIPVFYKNLQGHPKVIARRKRNKERNTKAYRMARRETPTPDEKQLMDTQKGDPRTDHWFERVA